MGQLYEQLAQDVRFVESLKACINCGTCTAICPASEFYNYDPRVIVITVQTQDDQQIEELLKGEAIWYCGECMSCKTRCPRGNTPGLVIMALRSLSQELGYFTESEKGRQQLAIKRTIGENILKYGYCVQPESVTPGLHPEQGPVWEWEYKNLELLMKKMGTNFHTEGPGALRIISENDLDEIRRIFEVTGGNERFDKIEEYSKIKAKEMGLEFGEGTDSEYFKTVYTTNNSTHSLL
ncbi:MAG: 4Fe-4S dicluster domain-containing protein [Bacteroidales bacterium]|nr:4Fe-4S dicluster domain-containing protein [Bacteroidales bacterium]